MFSSLQTFQLQCRLFVAPAWPVAAGPRGLVLPAGFAVCGRTEAQHQPSAPRPPEPLLPLSDPRLGHPQPAVHPPAQQRKRGLSGDVASGRFPRKEEHPGRLRRKSFWHLLPLLFIIVILPRATKQGGVSKLQPALLALGLYGCSLGLPDKHFSDSAGIG